MSGEQNGIEVFISRVFEKALDKMDEETLGLVEDEIEAIIDNPEIGTQKKGDISYLYVHKFKVHSQQLLLGYSWQQGELHLYLLNIGSLENFYRDIKKRRKADLKMMK